MSVAVELRRDSMKAIGQSVGATLSDATADAIAAIVEKRMNDLIQDARKFMRHSYRSTLCAADINAALRLRNMESVVGYSSSNPLAFQHISVQSASNEQSEFCYLDDPAIQLDSYLAQPLLDAGRKAPCDPNFSIHWLAIDGVQPRIPMNPLHEIDVSETELTSLADRELNSNSASGDAPAKRRRVTSVLAPDSESAGADATSSAAVIPLTKHLLSKEQQLYLENICSVLRAASTIDNFSLVANAVLPPAVKEARTLQRTVLKSLSTDAGIQPLVPFLVRFVAEEVSSNLTALPRLHAALRVAEALLSSPHAFLEPYLHQLVPAIMTCVVGRRLCEHPDEDHWSLRQRAARLLAEICSRFGVVHRTLHARVVRQLIGALCDPSKALTAHYGALVGLGALGHHVVRTALVPCIPVYLSLLQASLDASATASTVAIPQGPSRTSSSTSTTTSSSSKPKSASSARQAVVSCSGIPAEWAAAAREKRIATAVDDDAAASSSFSFPASVKFRPASVSNTLASDLSQDRVRAAAEKQTELTHCQGALTSVYGSFVRNQVETDGFLTQSDIAAPEPILAKLGDSFKPADPPAIYFVESMVPFVEASRRGMLSNVFV